MAGSFKVEIVSPDGSVFQGEAEIVRAPGVLGSFEVLHNHAPMIAAFDIGPLYVTTPGGEQIAFATSGGFLEVVDNVVTVLAETAEPSSNIDIERAKAAEAKALSALEKVRPEEREAAEKKLQRARNRLRVSMGSIGQRS